MTLTAKNLSKEFVSKQGEVLALENISLHIEDHEFVSIVGPSGCGKTTLLRLIAGLITPSSGSVDYGAQGTNGKPYTAMVFQEQGLFPWLNVIDNVAFGLEMQSVEERERHQRAQEFIERVGLDGFAYNYPHELSGGMRQRVALARAFLADPQVLLMDEPFGALDSQTRLVLQEELLRIWGQEKKTVLFITHDVEEAVVLSDRVLVMTGRPGRIREEIVIPLQRPRDLTVRDRPEVTEIKWNIWKMLESEVKQGLNL
ncbi:MAG: ABC transporter ATP-binding protein [Anaerolineae bacterium]|nr:ABC transporter ATP-binding protein [Anaerolineae bacterium]